MSDVLRPKTRQQRFFRRRDVESVIVGPPMTAERGDASECRALDDLFAAGCIGRPGYELARRQLQRAYRISLPDTFGRD